MILVIDGKSTVIAVIEAHHRPTQGILAHIPEASALVCKIRFQRSVRLEPQIHGPAHPERIVYKLSGIHVGMARSRLAAFDTKVPVVRTLVPFCMEHAKVDSFPGFITLAAEHCA